MNYRIYRNLHKGCYSIQRKVPGKGWRVWRHAYTLLAYGVTFQVSEAGRQRVLATGRKNVHAYIVAENIQSDIETLARQAVEDREKALVEGQRISYNPYVDGHFTVDGDRVESGDFVYLSSSSGWVSSSGGWVVNPTFVDQTTTAHVKAGSLRPADMARPSGVGDFRFVVTTWDFFTDEGGPQTGVRFDDGTTLATHRTWPWEVMG
jgi:hypothetical protein